MAPSPHASLGSRAACRFSDSLVRSKSERRVHRPLSPAREREGGYSSAPEDDAAPSKPPPALSMGVIVDRSSFDSEDRLNQGQRRHGSSASSTSSSGGEELPGTPERRKLRRRKMNWKPKLPPGARISSGGGRSDASTLGGRASLGSSTNATPRFSNTSKQRKLWERVKTNPKSRSGRSRGAVGVRRSAFDDTSTIATGATPTVTNRGGDRFAGHRRALGIISGSSHSDSASKADAEAHPFDGFGGAFTPYGEQVDPVGFDSPSKSGESELMSVPSPSATNSTAPLDQSALDTSGFGSEMSTPLRAVRAKTDSPAVPSDWASTYPHDETDQIGSDPPPKETYGNNLDSLIAASSLIIQPEDYFLAGGHRPSSPLSRGDDGGDGNLRLDDGDGLAPFDPTEDGSAVSKELAKLQAQSEGTVGLKPQSPSSSPARTAKQRSSTRSGLRARFGKKPDPDDYIDAERHLRAIHEVGAEHIIHGEYDEAVEVFQEIMRGQTQRHGPDHARVGTALHNLGIVYLKKRDYARAIEVCGQAVEVRVGALGPEHLDVAISLAQLGIAQLESNEHREALIAFRKALSIRHKHLGPKHPKIAKILNNMGCSLFELNELRGAMLAFEETLDIQRDMMKTKPESIVDESGPASAEQLLLSVAATLCNIGSIKLRLGYEEEAIVALEEALLIQQSVLGDEHRAVLNTVETIEFIEEKKVDGFGEEFRDATGCSLPLNLRKMMAVDVVETVTKHYKAIETMALDSMFLCS